jgi:hypothetical protein
MKLLLVIALALGGIFAWPYLRPQIAAPPTNPDPVAEMAKVARDFPRAMHSRSRGQTFFEDVKYDVHKTDSLVTPYVGNLDFSVRGEISYRYVFQWQKDRWIFASTICTDNGKDLTWTPGGLEIESGDEMKPYLEKYGWIAPNK